MPHLEKSSARKRAKGLITESMGRVVRGLGKSMSKSDRAFHKKALTAAGVAKVSDALRRRAHKRRKPKPRSIRGRR